MKTEEKRTSDHIYIYLSAINEGGCGGKGTSLSALVFVMLPRFYFFSVRCGFKAFCTYVGFSMEYGGITYLDGYIHSKREKN